MVTTPTLPPIPSTIANLPLAITPLAGTEFTVITQNGVTSRVSVNGFGVTGPTGPTGPAGPPGPQGTQGSPGSGNINAGVTNNLAFYASNGTGLSPLTLGTNLSIVGTTINATGGSGLVLLGHVTASNSATVDLLSLMSSTYDQYLIILENVFPITATANLVMRVSLDNSTFSSASNYGWVESSTNIASITTTTTHVANDTSFQIFPNQAAYGAGSNAGISGEILLFNANDPISHIPATFKSVGTDNTSGSVTVLQGGMAWNSNGPILAVRFLMSSGNINQGTFYMYGLAKS